MARLRPDPLGCSTEVDSGLCGWVSVGLGGQQVLWLECNNGLASLLGLGKLRVPQYLKTINVRWIHYWSLISVLRDIFSPQVLAGRDIIQNVRSRGSIIHHMKENLH